LLDDALAEARSENRKAVDELLSDSKRVKQEDGGWRFILSAADIEWLLVVLNDVRIGSWIELGSPEHPLGALRRRDRTGSLGYGNGRCLSNEFSRIGGSLK
jgi:hypothetical protein